MNQLKEDRSSNALQQNSSVVAIGKNRKADIWDELTDEETAIVSKGLEPQAGELVSMQGVIAQLQNKLDQQQQEVKLKPKLPQIKVPELGGNTLILSLAGIMSATCVLCVGTVTYAMYQTAPTRQIMSMTELSLNTIASSSREHSNALAFMAKENANIAKVAAKEKSNNFSLISWGQPQESQPERVEENIAPVYSPTAASPVAAVNPNTVIITKGNLNLRDAPNGKTINTIPIGDRFVLDGTIQDGWSYGNWQESNLPGWVNSSALDLVK